MIEKILSGIAALVLIIIVGGITYNELSYTNINVLVNLKENQSAMGAIKYLVPNDSSVTSIKKIEENKYKFVVRTKKNKNSFFEYFIKNNELYDAEIE